MLGSRSLYQVAVQANNIWIARRNASFDKISRRIDIGCLVYGRSAEMNPQLWISSRQDVYFASFVAVTSLSKIHFHIGRANGRVAVQALAEPQPSGCCRDAG